MRGVVVEAAAALVLRWLRQVAPLGLQHDRAVGLAEDVGDLADRAGVEQPLDLLEGADEAVVVADLGDQARARGQLRPARSASADVEVRTASRRRRAGRARAPPAPSRRAAATASRSTTASSSASSSIGVVVVVGRRARCTSSARRARSSAESQTPATSTSGWAFSMARWERPILPRPTTPMRIIVRAPLLAAVGSEITGDVGPPAGWRKRPR